MKPRSYCLWQETSFCTGSSETGFKQNMFPFFGMLQVRGRGGGRGLLSALVKHFCFGGLRTKFSEIIMLQRFFFLTDQIHKRLMDGIGKE